MKSIIPRRDPGFVARPRGLDPFGLMRELMSSWEPFGGLEAFRGSQGLSFVPTFDVKETKEAYIFKADMPGVKEEDLEVSVTGNQLTVSGHRQEERKTEEEDERYYTYERSYGSFSRSFMLPEGVASENAQADLKDGVLTLVVPKRPEVQPKRIEVKAGGKGAEKLKA